jgi:hypothetical protein
VRSAIQLAFRFKPILLIVSVLTAAPQKKLGREPCDTVLVRRLERDGGACLLEDSAFNLSTGSPSAAAISPLPRERSITAVAMYS